MKFLKILLSFLLLMALSSCKEIEVLLDDSFIEDILIEGEDENISLVDVPEYDGDPYVILNNNIPEFDESDFGEKSFEIYSELDDLGRCGEAYANLSQELMPEGERENISHIKPTGWNSSGYSEIEGKFLYNRCHLIGYQLAGENANELNLITGTRYLNVEGMLPFENQVAKYIRKTDHHVLYRVTPIYEGNNLVASGVIMEAQSIEDDEIMFNVYVYNVQPGVVINYDDGSNYLKANETGVEIRGNSRSLVYHCPGQRAYDEMLDSKYLVIFDGEKEAVEAGYKRANQ